MCRRTNVSLLDTLSSVCPVNPVFVSIAWPFEIDHPSNAAYISWTHEIGYELFEIRSGYGLLPIARLGNRIPTATVESVRSEFGDVLTKAFGEDGEKRRQNLLKLREKITEDWREGGASWKQLDRIISVAQASQLAV